MYELMKSHDIFNGMFKVWIPFLYLNILKKILEIWPANWASVMYLWINFFNGKSHTNLRCQTILSFCLICTIVSNIIKGFGYWVPLGHLLMNHFRKILIQLLWIIIKNIKKKSKKLVTFFLYINFLIKYFKKYFINHYP